MLCYNKFMNIYISGISGTGMGPLALMAKDAGMNEHLAKPVDINKMFRVMCRQNFMKKSIEFYRSGQVSFSQANTERQGSGMGYARRRVRRCAGSIRDDGRDRAAYRRTTDQLANQQEDF